MAGSVAMLPVGRPTPTSIASTLTPATADRADTDARPLAKAFIISTVRAVAICVLTPLGYAYFGIDGAILAVVLVPAVPVPYVLWAALPYLGQRQTQFESVYFGLAIALTVYVFFGG